MTRYFWASWHGHDHVDSIAAQVEPRMIRVWRRRRTAIEKIRQLSSTCAILALRGAEEFQMLPVAIA
jgi:hypothetical protein